MVTDENSGCPRKELLAAYIDFRLANNEKDQLEAHLADCVRCRQEFIDLSRLVGKVKEMKVSPSPRWFEKARKFILGKQDPRTISAVSTNQLPVKDRQKTALVPIIKQLLMRSIMVAPWAPLIWKSIAGIGTRKPEIQQPVTSKLLKGGRVMQFRKLVALAMLVCVLLVLIVVLQHKVSIPHPPYDHWNQWIDPPPVQPIKLSQVESVKTPEVVQLYGTIPVSFKPSTPISPDYAGAIISDQKAEVYIVVNATEAGPPDGKLRVILWGQNGKLIGGYERDIKQKKDQAVYKFEFEGNDLEKARVHVTLGSNAWEDELSALKINNQEVRVLMSDRISADATSAARILVNGLSSYMSIPIEGASVKIELVSPKGHRSELFSGKTDKRSMVEPRMVIPDLPEGDYLLAISATSGIQESKMSFPVKIVKSFKILLITDKPLYQPGQEILIRALALDELNLRPVNKSEVLIEIEDAKGNKVFKRKVTTSEFGIAHTRFQLASEVALGDYKISATMGKIKSEKTVTVKRYVLPRFEVKVNVEKKFYLPKEIIKGTLDVRYFFGKSVIGGEVEIKASTFDVAFKEFASVKPPRTDSEGRTTFEVPLPDYFVGQPLEKGDAFVKLDISVKDTAEHVEKVTRNYPVASQPLRLTLVPESGRLIPDVENIIFLLATYPDGTPAATEFKLRAGSIEIYGKTDAVSGFTAIRLTPKSSEFHKGEYLQARGIFTQSGRQYPQQYYQMMVLDCVVEACDERGAKAKLTQLLSSDPMRDNMLLRLDKAIYNAGESINVDVFTTGNSGSVYVDIIKNRQTLLTHTIDLIRGHGATQWNIPAEIFGTLEVHAYQILAGTGEIIRDTRVIYAQPASNLKIKVDPDKDVYRPRNTDGTNPEGKDAIIRFLVTDSGNSPVKSALGVIVVDNAVYALQEMQPGLEKIYFTLEEELQNPKYTLKDAPFQIQALVKEREQIEAKKQDVAKALLAQVEPLTEYKHGTIEQTQNFQNLSQVISDLNYRLQYYIQRLAVARAETIFELDPRTGRVRYTKDALDKIGGLYFKQQLKDTSGREISLQDLIRFMPEFAPERVTVYIDSYRKSQIWNALANQCVNDVTALEYKDGTFRYKKDILKNIGLSENYFKDSVGITISLDELSKKDPAFDPANLAKHVLNLRKKHLLQALVNYVCTDGNLEKIMTRRSNGYIFREGILETLIKSKNLVEAHAFDPWGKHFNLQALSIIDEDFYPENFLKYVANNQWWRIYSALANYGWRHPEILDRNTNRWIFPADILSRLVKEGLLKGFDLIDPWGNPIKISSDPQAGLPVHIDQRLQGTKLAILGPDAKADTADDITSLTAKRYGFEGELYLEHRFKRAGGGGLFAFQGLKEQADMQIILPSTIPMDAAETEYYRKGADKQDKGSEVKPLFVREWFPETLLFVPELVTDEKGYATLPLKIADSITTWRLTASAVSMNGLLGSVEHEIRVFQDFFIEPDLPVALTQNDEISLPIAVYNYLPSSQRIRLVLEAIGEPWFELMEEREKIIELEKNEVRAVFFRIKVKKIGDAQTLQVTAYGTKMSDAVKKSVRVEPDGKMFEEVKNDRLGKDVSMTLHIPQNAIEGSYKIICKCYPGIFAQVLEGVEGILSAPHG